MEPDRREAKRARAYRPVRIQLPRTQQLIETLTRDISTAGFCCVSPTVFPVSTEVKAELMLSTGSEPMALNGRTAWFRTLPESEQCHIGVSFIDMQLSDKQRLSAYLERIERL
jgi:c-di-GMP-binding flagellar brake protein YcgR